MAIIIPSKNIYEISNNKVLDNKIKKIEVNASEVVPDNEYDTTVHNEKVTPTISDFHEYWGEHAAKSVKINPMDETTGYMDLYVAYLKIHPQYVRKTLHIPKLKFKSYIDYIYSGVDDNDNANIKVSVKARKTYGTATGSYNIDYAEGSNVRVETTSFENTEKDTYTISEENIEYNYTHSFGSGKHNEITVELKSLFDDISQSNIKSDSLKIESDDNDNYVITLVFLSGYERTTLSGFKMDAVIGDFELPLVGDCEKYEFLEADITINGDTIGIDLTEKPFVYGESTNSKAIFSIENNELIQTSTEEGFDIPKIIANKTISQYANGKETAEIRCSISDYKNEDESYAIRIPKNKSEINTEDILVTTDLSNGTVVVKTLSPMFYDVKVTGTCAYKIINGIFPIFKDFEVILKSGQYTATKNILEYPSSYAEMTLQNVKKELYGFRMQFQDGDIVIPYVLGANGIDKPMSLNKDNAPKAFEVISTEIYYDGAVWQNLVLQEYTNDFGDGEVITDLTNTSWRINEGWTAEAGYGMFLHINGHIQSFVGEWNVHDEDFVALGIGYYLHFGDVEVTPYGIANQIIFTGSLGTWLSMALTPDMSSILTITGGTNATNPDLIAWLQANATMQ